MFKRLPAFLGLWVVCLAQDQFSLESEFYLTNQNNRFTPTRIAAINENRFVLLDPDSREIALFGQNGIIIKSGGFGQGIESFSEPTDIIVQNLHIWISDRSENLIQRFDYSLNYVGSVSINENASDPLYSDLIIINPFGNPYVFTSTYGEIWPINDYAWPFIELNQFNMNGKCVVDISSDYKGNIYFLTCEDEIIIFNRYGRNIGRKKVNITKPKFLISTYDIWMAFNDSGKIQISDHNEEQMIHLNKGEYVLDIDGAFQKLILLTNQRILVLK